MTSTSERAASRQAFLAEAGFTDAAPAPLAGDASTRSYFRLARPGRAPLILMDAPPSAESPVAAPDASLEARRALGYNAAARLAAGRVDAFAGVAAYLRTRTMSAPEIHALDVEAGFAVLEDLGPDLFATRLRGGEDAVPLYAAAVDLLAELHASAPPHALAFRVRDVAGAWPLLGYDDLALRAGVDVFLEWWPRFARRREFSDAAADEWEAIWSPIRARGAAQARVFTHRDFHAENLIWRPDRRGAARVGLLDFQDAVRGHPAWDLLSLLQDARREVAPELETRMVARYCDAAGVGDAEAFGADYAALAALNNLRILGVFARLVARDAKPRYAGFMDRMWRLLDRDLTHPTLSPIRAWLGRHAPEAPLA